jgi:hypothetical protein
MGLLLSDKALNCWIFVLRIPAFLAGVRLAIHVNFCLEIIIIS